MNVFESFVAALGYKTFINRTIMLVSVPTKTQITEFTVQGQPTVNSEDTCLESLNRVRNEFGFRPRVN